MHITEAAVGVIQRDNGMVLLGERPKGKPWAGYWEFPGGKVEAGETPAQALARELHEELGIRITQFTPWITRTYHYEAKHGANGLIESPAKTVKLHFFIVTAWEGVPIGVEGQQLSWQVPDKCTVSPMLPANAPILTGLSLSPIYALTHLKGLGKAAFIARLKVALEQGLSMIQVREPHLSTEAFALFAEYVVELATPFEAKVFIHHDIALAKALNATGVHLTAQALMQLQVRPEGLLCGASCHNAQELAHAQMLGLDYVTLSPVKPTLSHPEAQGMGWAHFSQLISGYGLPVYALAGMQRADLPTARQHGAHGIAMLRDVWGLVSEDTGTSVMAEPMLVTSLD